MRPLELDAIEALTLDPEASRQRAIRLQRERRRSIIVEHDPAPRRRHRRQNAHSHVGAPQRGDVATALHLLRRETGVGRIVVFELELPDRGQIDQRHREDRRADAAGFDVIVDRRVQMEQHAFEGSRIPGGRERHALEYGVSAGPHHESGVGRFEPDEPRRHGLIRSTRHRRAAGTDVNLVRTRRFRASRNDQQRRHAVAQVRGTKREEQRGRRDDRACREQVSKRRAAVDRLGRCARSAAFHRERDELVDERR